MVELQAKGMVHYFDGSSVGGTDVSS